MNNSKYSTQVMKDDECLCFIETAIENGSDVKEAIQDMRMIDNLLFAERNYFLTRKYVTKTSNGHYRRGCLLFNALESIVEGRALNINM